MTDIKTNILIVEDEFIIAEIARKMLTSLDYEVAGMASDIQTAFQFLEKGNISLVLLDINLEDGNEGIEIAKVINEKYHIPFIFLTSYGDMETRKEANLTHPLGYITKPFNKAELHSGIEIALATVTSSLESITIKMGYSDVKIKLEEILWIKSDKGYVEIVTIDKKHVHRTSLEALLSTLEVPKFQRVHRSYAVNVNKIATVNSNYVSIEGHQIPISRKYKEELSEKFKG